MKPNPIGIDLQNIMLFACWIRTSMHEELITQENWTRAGQWHLMPTIHLDVVTIVAVRQTSHGTLAEGFCILEVLTKGGVLLKEAKDILDFILQ